MILPSGVPPDNQHAVWQGHWTGWPSLVDQWTQGAGWVCLLFLAVAWGRGGRWRGMVMRLFLVFLAFTMVVSLLWSTVHSSPTNYTLALDGGIFDTGGRYLYPVMLAWLVGGVVLLLRTLPREPEEIIEKGMPSDNEASPTGGVE